MHVVTAGSLFAPVGVDGSAAKPGSPEAFDELLSRPGLRLERIVSHGQPTPEGVWYDQAGDEWVLLARGSAVLAFENQAPVELRSGDHVFLPAQCRHRVSCVSADAVWLALHLPAGSGAAEAGAEAGAERPSPGLVPGQISGTAAG